MKSNKPKIRFSNYDDAWEQRKLGEVVQKYEDLVKTPTEGYERLGIRSHAKGTFHSYVERGKELETARMSRVAANKFIVNITFGWEHAVAITDENDAGKLVSHRFPQYTFNSNMVPGFFRYLILDERFKYHLGLSSPGGAGRNRVLNLMDMLDYKITFPTQPGQKKIATYFDSFDSLITLHQRKLELIKEYKKTMLRKMFPATGRSVPEIRFEGFTDAWEQRKFSELVNRISMSSENKVLPRVEYEDIISGQGILNKDLYLKENNKKGNEFKENDILFGYLRPYLDNRLLACFNGIAVGDWWVLRSQNCNVNFIYSLIQTQKFQSIANLSTGTKMPRANWSTVASAEYLVPSNIKEQSKIGEFISVLDNLITLHQRKLEDLEDQKKYFLKKMFV